MDVIQESPFELDRRTYLKLAAGVPLAIGNVSAAETDCGSASNDGFSDRRQKFDRLDSYLEDNDLASVWFADSDSYVWLTGQSNIIDRSSSTGVAAVGYDGDGLTIVVDNDEKALVRESLFRGPSQGDQSDESESDSSPRSVEIVTFDWHASTVGETVAEVAPTPAAADFDVPEFDSVTATPLRQPLTEHEQQLYAEIGTDTASAVESVCKTLEPDDTELQVARAISGMMDACGLDHPVVLVAGEERAQQYRHPVPTEHPLEGYVTISVVGRRDGMYASCTRTVAFDPPSWFEQRNHDVLRVDATALGATRRAIANGDTAGDVFESIQTAYAEAGVPDEWQLHHQGGAAGYASREWVATPESTTPVTGPMAYAWNPTLQGTKSEGTVLVSEDGYDPLTLTGEWPTTTVESFVHDESVERPDVLYR